MEIIMEYKQCEHFNTDEFCYRVEDTGFYFHWGIFESLDAAQIRTKELKFGCIIREIKCGDCKLRLKQNNNY